MEAARKIQAMVRGFSTRQRLANEGKVVKTGKAGRKPAAKEAEGGKRGEALPEEEPEPEKQAAADAEAARDSGAQTSTQPVQAVAPSKSSRTRMWSEPATATGRPTATPASSARALPGVSLPPAAPATAAPPSGPADGLDAAALAQRVQELEKELAQVQGYVAEAEAYMDGQVSDMADLQQVLSKLRVENGVLRDKVERARASAADHERRAKELEGGSAARHEAASGGDAGVSDEEVARLRARVTELESDMAHAKRYVSEMEAYIESQAADAAELHQAMGRLRVEAGKNNERLHRH